MPSFTPPTEDTVPPIDTESSDRQDLGWYLMRHYSQGRAGRNVYILSDNTATEDDPWDVTPPNVTVVRTFHGGREGSYSVTAAEQTILEAAGFVVDP